MKKITVNDCVTEFRHRQKRPRSLRYDRDTSTQTKSEYSVSFELFDPETRSAKVEIRRTYSQRKVLRYYQRNYQRYPVYSAWEQKTKSLNKTLRLTSEILEGLEKNGDEIISLLSDWIVDCLPNRVDLLPSWYCLKAVDYYFEGLFGKTREKNGRELGSIDYSRKIKKRDKRDCESELYSWKSSLALSQKELQRATTKACKASKLKSSIALAIATFGIYGYLSSTRRIAKLQAKRSEAEDAANQWQKAVEKKQKEIEACEAEIRKLDETEKILMAKAHEEEHGLELQRQELRNGIHPILVEYDEKLDGFIGLSTFAGTKRKKIIGCYAIRNRENGKVYVGQSKDVYKRILTQHFNGTEVKNIIFAEDYYTSSLDDKSQLFEVRIIPCSTKDELDSTEKELIELYDSFRNGYNKTSGNE